MSDINIEISGIELYDNGSGLNYQVLNLIPGKKYFATLLEGTDITIYLKISNGSGYEQYPFNNNKILEFICPLTFENKVAIYSSSNSFSTVVFSTKEKTLETQLEDINENVKKNSEDIFENSLITTGYKITNNSANLVYQELPLPIKQNSIIKAILSNNSINYVTIYTKSNANSDYVQQGILSKSSPTLILNTEQEITQIAIYNSTNSGLKEIFLTGEEGSLQSQLDTLKQENNAIKDIVTNKVNDNTLFENLLYFEGYIVYSHGNFSPTSNYLSTDFILIKGIEKVVFSAYMSDAAGIAFYDKNKEYITGQQRQVDLGANQETSVPSNAYYLRICYIKEYKEKFYLKLLNNGEICTASSLKEFLFLYDLKTLSNKYITYSTGTAVDASSYFATDYITIIGQEIEFPIYFSDAAGIAFYDENKEYISGFGRTSESIGDIKQLTIPSLAKYIRICCLSTSVDKLYLKCLTNLIDTISEIFNITKQQEENPCFYTESNGCRTFNKILCIGDSLTQGTFEYKDNQDNLVYFNDDRYSYPTFLKAISGRNVTNAGTGGLTTKSWWEMHQNDDFSGHDACIIALGRNDYVEGRETTSEERFTYMANIINAVRAANSKIKVFIATMLNYYKGTGADAVNNDMRAIAEQNNCFLVDISRYGKIEQRDYSYSHLTATGYEKVANYYFNYISYIMANQPREFMNIQFVGTDYSFNS